MTYRFHSDLADAARKSGLKVVELDGWRTRGRPSTTGHFDPSGILVHHTGSSTSTLAYAWWMATEGRSDLPAPLCQIALGDDGTVYISAAGRCNHAGESRASGPMPAAKDGNALYIGIEAMNAGNGRWTEAQYDAYVRLCAALCAHYGWDASRVRAHRETSVTGKPDPAGIDMDVFRRQIAERMRNPEEDDVSAADVWNHKINTDTGEVSAAIAVRRSLAQSTRGREAAEAALKQANRNRDAIKVLGDKLDAVAPGVAAAVAAALGDLVKVEVSVTTNATEEGA